MSFAERLKQMREYRNLSRKELAELLGVTPATVHNYENGTSAPREDILFKLMKILGCDANFLYQDEIVVPPISFTTTISEQKIITKIRSLNARRQQVLKEVLDALVTEQQVEKQKKHD